MQDKLYYLSFLSLIILNSCSPTIKYSGLMTVFPILETNRIEDSFISTNVTLNTETKELKIEVSESKLIQHCKSFRLIGTIKNDSVVELTKNDSFTKISAKCKYSEDEISINFYEKGNPIRILARKRDESGLYGIKEIKRELNGGGELGKINFEKSSFSGLYKSSFPSISIELQYSGNVFVTPKQGKRIYCSTKGNWKESTDKKLIIELDILQGCEWISDLAGRWELSECKTFGGNKTYCLQKGNFTFIKE